ncbi:hypothetical protein DFJ67_6611 [Asanoa ferruginea]|uniref:Butirosin biosynthesis protein H-like n=1 Tax=Asanoa ferruginea TaxID=53367 RepID=A0A3D9ZT42_9ACTN|nr:hypothetical protein [Asanoa ferruginea]REG00557.1 hypothetical protein DFJ67_6611 [Asanoa ferruginea]GIF47721.1 hypothetical protein Afe04nite_22600 [Asanoa ferruginea]
MRHLPYVGNGPYCYANSFAMLLGDRSPSTAVIEVATGGPFGMQLVGGNLVFFDAYGWDPEQGFDQALAAIGWTSATSSGGDPLARLAAAAGKGPVWAGPLEMGHLRHHPEMTGPIGADHFVVVLDVNDERVLVHDPHGYPYAEVPVEDFLLAWRAETVSYGQPYTMRTDFVKVADVADADAIRSTIPAAIAWLAMEGDPKMPPGSLGNGEAAERVAQLIEAGAGDGLREHLIYFAIRVGARRLSDTADCLRLAGFPEAARIATTQARLVGSLQHPMVTRDLGKAAAALRELAPTYDKLRSALT